jgi:hypothetical protein
MKNLFCSRICGATWERFMEPEAQPKLDAGSTESLGSASGSPERNQDRNWAPMAIAAAVVIAVVAAVLVLGGHSKRGQEAASSSAAPDPYAANLPISGLSMSESSNLAGGKVTYINGHIANQGDRTVNGALVQVVFRDYKNEVAQSEKLPLTVIRMREPYIDTATLAVIPLKPGAQQDFRLNFDSVSPDWSGTLPEVRIVHVDLKLK